MTDREKKQRFINILQNDFENYNRNTDNKKTMICYLYEAGFIPSVNINYLLVNNTYNRLKIEKPKTSKTERILLTAVELDLSETYVRNILAHASRKRLKLCF